MRGALTACRRLQELGLGVLLFMLPASPAAVEISFFLLLLGWTGQRLLEGWLELLPTPRLAQGSGLRAQGRSSTTPRAHSPEPRASEVLGQALGRRTPGRILGAAWRSSVWSGPRQQACLLMLLAYVGLCGLTIFSSDSPIHSLNGWIYKTVEYALFLIIVPDVIRTPKAAGRAVVVLMASAAVVGLDAFAQELIGRDPLRGHRLSIYRRMTGPYTNPGDLACYIMVVLPIILTSLGRVRGWRRVAPIALALGLLGCLVRVESQGAWLGFAIGLGVMAGCLPRARRAIVVTALLFCLAGGWWLHREGRLGSVVRLSDIGTRDRIVVWQAAWRMIEDRPIVGHGLNTFMARYLDYWVGGERQPRYAHNCYLQAAAETGVIGLVLFVGLLGALFCRLAEGLRAASPSTKLMLTGLTGGLAAFAVQASLDTNFYSLRQATLFWVLMGVGIGLCAGQAAAPAPEQAAEPALLVADSANPAPFDRLLNNSLVRGSRFKVGGSPILQR